MNSYSDTRNSYKEYKYSPYASSLFPNKQNEKQIPKIELYIREETSYLLHNSYQKIRLIFPVYSRLLAEYAAFPAFPYNCASFHISRCIHWIFYNHFNNTKFFSTFYFILFYRLIKLSVGTNCSCKRIASKNFC